MCTKRTEGVLLFGIVCDPLSWPLILLFSVVRSSSLVSAPPNCDAFFSPGSHSEPSLQPRDPFGQQLFLRWLSGGRAYHTRHPENARRAMLERWSEALDLPTEFSFRGLMSTESQLLVWKGEGLPADDLSQVKG